jgi:hypothetical protein
MPPLAIVFGPDEVPLGENGCLANATRNRPSGAVYRCAYVAPDVLRRIAIAKAIRLRIPLSSRLPGQDKPVINNPGKNEGPTLRDHWLE